MHRRAEHGRANVLAHEGAVARKLLQLTVKIHLRIGQFPPPLGGKNQHGGDAAVDVYLAVGMGGPRGITQRIERLFVGFQVQRQRF